MMGPQPPSMAFLSKEKIIKDALHKLPEFFYIQLFTRYATTANNMFYHVAECLNWDHNFNSDSNSKV